ncbi:MAG: hypothetical protein JXC36_05890 [Candidatus Atribacteria bacterium]|nr:hypothetical protein [Candidatus Atribacteria bacterium]
MKQLFFSLFIMTGIHGYSSTIDTTLFSDKFEENTFRHYLDSVRIDPIDLFLCLDYEKQKATATDKRLKELIIVLEQKGIRNKNLKKQINLIYSYVHANLLKKYVEDIYFYDIFSNGHYNCVTASALYALLLEHFNIEYIVKETPQHVYLIADPGNSKVVIESTLPNKGVYVYDEKAKRDFILFLANNKTISQEELNSHSVDELFEEHYDKNKTINIYQLAAIQYYNKAVFQMQNSRFNEAAKNLEKAYLIYPSNMIKYNLNAALANIINEQNLKKNYDGKVLAKYLNLNQENAEAINYGNDFFKVVSSEWVINHPRLDNYKCFYNDFSNTLSDSIDQDKYSQTYYYFLGFYDYTKGNYASALKRLNFAYLANPENVEIEQLIDNVGMKYIFTDRNHEVMIDTIEYYFTLFPFLAEKQMFQQYYTYCYLRVVSEAYTYGNIKKGQVYINRFENVLAENPQIAANEEYIESAYGEVAAYYVRQQRYDMAMDYLKKGLKFAPNSLALKERIESIKSFRNIIYSTNFEKELIALPTKQEDFEEDFNRCFPKCWKAKSIDDGSSLKDFPLNEKFEIVATKSKKVEFVYKNEKKSGRWAVRLKSKLLYLVPSGNENDYLLFKIVEINDLVMKLRPYEGSKLSPVILVMEACKR